MRTNIDFEYLRKSLETLKEVQLIYLDEYEMLKERLSKMEKNEGFFMTKPFRCNDTMGKSLYMLMRTLSIKFVDKFREAENED